MSFNARTDALLKEARAREEAQAAAEIAEVVAKVLEVLGPVRSSEARLGSKHHQVFLATKGPPSKTSTGAVFVWTPGSGSKREWAGWFSKTHQRRLAAELKNLGLTVRGTKLRSIW